MSDVVAEQGASDPAPAVLVIDDDAAIRAAVRRFLERER